jgi:hypothetical protein
MHPWSQALLLGYAPAQISQLCPLFFAESRTKTFLVLGCDAREITKYFMSSLRHVQRVIPTIFDASTALNNSL